MPAEWENPRAILMAYPSNETDWSDILHEARKQFNDIIEALIEGREFVWLIANDGILDKEVRERIEDNEGRIISEIPYNDTWTRDYGPITVIETSDDRHSFLKELDFGFNGWGLKFASDKDNMVNLNMVNMGYRPSSAYENNRDFILEGGSIDTDGKGTILTTTRCLCSPNRNGGKTKQQLEIILREKLGARNILWLDYGFLEGDDTDSHVDTLARMAPEDTILYVGPPSDRTDIHYSELKKMEDQLRSFRTTSGKTFRLLSLPLPEPIYDKNGDRLPATYANYLVTGWNLYMPVYDQPVNDLNAKHVLQMAFPQHKIYTVDCRILIRQHGSLHCSTMQLY